MKHIKNNNFFKKYSTLEFKRYEFEHDMSIERPYITEEYYYRHRYTMEGYSLYCPACKEKHNVSELSFMNQKIVCKCGASYAADELGAYMHDYMNSNNWMNHNIANDTFNKVSVSTILGNKLYCSKCHSTHHFSDLQLDGKQRVCTCGEKHSFDDLKLVAGDCYTAYTAGNIYYDGHKITISFLEYYTDINGNGQYYWQSGGQRLTMNLETGFSYLYNDGYRYREFNRTYKRDHGTNAPKMFNCTYSCCANTLELTVSAIMNTLMIKHTDKPNLISLINKRRGRLSRMLFSKLFKQVDDYMTAYYNNKYSYRIKSLMELSNNEFRNYESWMLPLRNRFINASKNQLEKARDIVQVIKQTENKRNYKRLSREANEIDYEFICKTTKLSKKLKKEIYSQLQNRYQIPAYIEQFAVFTKFFKNKENINKVYNTFKRESSNYFCYTYRMTDNVMKLWMSYRDEQYLSNLEGQELRDKLNEMSDAMHSINKLRKVYGSDWDINSVRFHNEKQFHDEFVRLINSEEFLRLYNAEAYEKERKPFEMEDDIYELEKDTEIQIARNRATLTNIGQAMGICVGGYGGQVESGRCRIAYLKVNDKYEVCIELNKHKNPETKKFEYTIVQAKLRYNELVGKKEFYYNIVKEWADKHNIRINTYDMEVHNEVKTTVNVGVEF